MSSAGPAMGHIAMGRMAQGNAGYWPPLAKRNILG